MHIGICILYVMCVGRRSVVGAGGSLNKHLFFMRILTLRLIASFRTIKIFRFHIALVVEYLSGLLTLTLLQFAIDLLLSFGLAQGTCHIQELVVAQLLAMQSNDGGQRRLWILKGDKSKAARTSLLIEHKLQIKNHKHHSIALAGQTPRPTPPTTISVGRACAMWATGAACITRERTRKSVPQSRHAARDS